MPLRFEAWTLPSTGAFTKRFDIPDVLPGATGTVELSTYSDARFTVPATFSKLDQLVSTTTGSLIKVFKGGNLIDEFEAARIDEAAGRPNVRTISGPQRNGLLEGIGLAPKGYPDHKAGAMHWKYGAENILPDLDLADLGSIREEWEIVLLGERYQLDLSLATAGTFTLNPDGIGATAAIDFDADEAAIKSALEALAGIDDVSVVQTDDQGTPPTAFWIVFEDPKDLTTDMTLDDSGLTGSVTLTKFNDGFSATTETFTITVDGQTTSALDWDASPNDVEGSATNNTGLQGLSNVNDVTVDGSGTMADPWIITFHDPPDISAFSITWADTALVTQIVAGQLDPSPITKSKPVDAGSGSEEDHGDYGTPPIEVVTTPLDTDAEWTLLVRARAIYAGSQLLVGVTPGQTYSNITIPVYANTTAKFVWLVKDLFENRLATTHATLTAGSYQDLTIPSFTVPDGMDQVLLRVAIVDANPANIDHFFASWQTATMLEGEPEAPFTKITREMIEAAQARGVGDWVELDATDTADSLGNTLPDLSYTAFVGDNSNLVNAHLDEGRKRGYQWFLAPAADALVITPAGTTTHVLQIFKVDADEIEDLTASPGGPSVLVGSHVPEAQLVTRRYPYTTGIGLGTGNVSAEVTDASAEAGIGRVERIFDLDGIGNSVDVDSALDAQFAEQALNQKALSATLLETATQLPGVDFGAGSKIWWQFPGIHAKEARPVKRWTWTHGHIATFGVQGSRVLNGESAQAHAIDMFLRKPGRRRDDRTKVVGGEGGGPFLAGAHIHLVAGTTQTIAVGGDPIEWSGLHSSIRPLAFDTISFPASTVKIREAGYYTAILAVKWASYMDGGSVWITRSRSGVESKVWPPSEDTGEFNATDGQQGSWPFPAIPCEVGDVLRFYIDHDDSATHDLEKATLGLYLVEPIREAAIVSSCPTLGSAVTVSSVDHDAFPGLAYSGRWIIGYREGTAHSSGDGDFKIRTSTDGVTWSSATTLDSLAGIIYSGGTLNRLSTGRVVAVLGLRDTVPDPIPDGGATAYSDDDGATWTTPVQIDDQGFTDWSVAENNLVELSNGDWLLPIYGADIADSGWSIRILKSTDSGTSWSLAGDVHDGAADSKEFAEPGLVKIGSQIICFIRENAGDNLGLKMWRSVSNDDGATWSTPELVLENIGGRPTPTLRTNGDLVIAARVRPGSTYPTQLIRSSDRGVTWELCEELAGDYNVYGQAAEDPDGKLGLVYAVENVGQTTASVFFRRET